MKEVSITREKFSVASCNICYARNYESDNERALGVYKEDLYNLHIGNMCICLCKDCLRLIGNQIIDLFAADGKDTKGERK